MNKTTIAVTGATGYLGGHVAHKLSAAGWATRLIARNPSRLPALPHAQAAKAHYQDLVAMTAAFEGVERVFFVSGNELSGRLDAHKTVIDACAAAGVKRVVYTSFLGAGPNSVFTLSQDHYQTEMYLAEMGVPFVALRNSFYAEIILEMVQDGVIRGPGGNGKLAPVARSDVIDSAVGALTAPHIATGAVDVTGPTAISLAEIASIHARITGRPTIYQGETLEQAIASRAHYDASDAERAAWVSTYQAIAVGELSATTNTVQRLTGHAPMDFASFLRKQLHII